MPFRSPLLRQSFFTFFSSSYLDVSVHSLTFINLFIQLMITHQQCARFPHSDSCGSTFVGNSPQLFAAFRVLLRLLAPRYPSCTLSSLVYLHWLHISFYAVVKVLFILSNKFFWFIPRFKNSQKFLCQGKFYGAERNRTADNLLARQVLYQLS